MKRQRYPPTVESMYHFIPVAIRHKGKDTTNATSGLLLMEGNDHFILTITHFPVNGSFTITTNHQLPDTVNWYPSSLVSSYSLIKHPQVFEQLKFFKKRFNLVPADCYSDEQSNKSWHRSDTSRYQDLRLVKLRVRDLRGLLRVNGGLGGDLNGGLDSNGVTGGLRGDSPVDLSGRLSNNTLIGSNGLASGFSKDSQSDLRDEHSLNHGFLAHNSLKSNFLAGNGSLDNSLTILKNSSFVKDYLTNFLNSPNSNATLTFKSKSSSINQAFLDSLKLSPTENKSNFSYPRPISFDPPSVGDSFTIPSFPFNFTNSLLFSNFISKGTINYKLHETFFLSDVKYLENTVGAPVITSNGSAGLVLGQLIKSNGDGDLTIILPWSIIWHFLNNLPMNDVFSSGGLSAEELISPKEFLQNEKRLDLVFPILLSNNKSSKWGSCIYYKKGVFITNNHVINDLDEKLNCTIFINSHYKLHIKPNQINTPFKDLDLSFINVETSNIPATPITKAENYFLGEDVSSIGYGLFFNSSNLNPLKSAGHISCTFELPVIENGPKVNSVIVTSSSCWNGSSGGGLFNENNEFIGLICSNAQVKVPSFDSKGKFLNNTDKIEKLAKFSLIIPIEIIDHCFLNPNNINGKIINLWLLNSYHNDILVESSKL